MFMLTPLCLGNNALYINFQCPLNLRRLLRCRGAFSLLTFYFCWLDTDNNKALGDDTATRLKISDLNHYKEGRSTITWNTQPGDTYEQEIIYFLNHYRFGSVCYISFTYPDSNATFWRFPSAFHFPEFIIKHVVYISVHTI